MSLFRGNKLLTPAVNLINNSRFSFAHKLASTVKKEDEALPLDFFRENCILVDANDNPIGSASKRDCHKVEGDGIRLHRAFSVFLFNKDGDMLLQKRSSHKVSAVEISSSCHWFIRFLARLWHKLKKNIINISLHHQTKTYIKLA